MAAHKLENQSKRLRALFDEIEAGIAELIAEIKKTRWNAALPNPWEDRR